jgi:type I site-specific restriction-modification system R (restriction) subunit
MALLHKEEDREERRRMILEEAEEFRRRHPVPDQKELLERIERRRLASSRNPNAPDSVDLIREDRDR